MLSRLRNWIGNSPQPPAEPVEDIAPKRPHPIDTTDADFDDIVLGADRLAIVDFWADWCQPCTIMSAYMEFLTQEFGEQIVIAALDVEENPDTPARYGVQGLPTLIMFRDGEEIDRHMGVVEYNVLQSRVERLLSTPVQSNTTQSSSAQQELASGDVAIDREESA